MTGHELALREPSRHHSAESRQTLAGLADKVAASTGRLRETMIGAYYDAWHSLLGVDIDERDRATAIDVPEPDVSVRVGLDRAVVRDHMRRYNTGVSALEPFADDLADLARQADRLARRIAGSDDKTATFLRAVANHMRTCAGVVAVTWGEAMGGG